MKNQEYADYYDISKGMQQVDYPAYTLWRLSTAHRIGKAVLGTSIEILDDRPRYYYLNAPVTDGINLQAGISVDVDRLF